MSCPYGVWLGLLVVIAALALLHWAIPYGIVTAIIFCLASLVGAAAVFAAYRVRPGLNHPQSWLLIGIAAAVLVWALVIEPYGGFADRDFMQLAIAWVYPVIGLLLSMFVLKLVFLSVERSPTLIMIMAGVTILVVVDIIHAHGVTTGWYRPGGAIDTLWFAVYGLFAAAPWHASATSPLTHSKSVAEKPFLRLLFIGVIAISVPALVLIMADSNRDLVRVGTLAFVILFLLMLGRMGVLLRKNQRQSEALEHMIRTDPLTGAANRRWLKERLDLEMARARRTGAP